MEAFLENLGELSWHYLSDGVVGKFLLPGEWSSPLPIRPIFFQLSQEHLKNASMENGLTLPQNLIILISIFVLAVIKSFPLDELLVIYDGHVLIIGNLEISQEFQIGYGLKCLVVVYVEQNFLGPILFYITESLLLIYDTRPNKYSNILAGSVS